MDLVAHTGMSEGKIDIILKAAQKRLGLYGYEKTTMREIAADISMSKASLYYYFPDKESLFKAVIENEQQEFSRLLERRIAEVTQADQMIMELVELRHSVFRKFLNLSKFRLADNHKMKPLLKELYDRMRAIETEFLTTVFISGKESGVFQFEDASELALLFSDMLQGMRIMAMRNMSSLEMTNQENEELIIRLRDATILIINGLKYNKITRLKHN